MSNIEEASFIGRDEPLKRLTKLAQASKADLSLRVTLIEGDPGIGKTALVSEFVRRHQRLGWKVLWGSCAQDGTSPYGPIRGATGCLVSSVLPDRAEMVEKFVEILTQHCVDQPIVLVIDDLHWADDWSVSFLEFLASNKLEIPCLVCVTARTMSIRDISKLRQILRQRGDLMSLDGVDPKELSSIFEHYSGRALSDGEDIRLKDFCGENPLCIVHCALAASGKEQTEWFIESSFPLPKKLESVLLRRFEALSLEGKRITEILAQVRVPITVSILSAVLNEDDIRLLGIARLLVEGGFVRSVGERYTISHGLLRQIVVGQASATASKMLNRRIGRVLKGEMEEEIEEIAFHFDRSDDHFEAFDSLWLWSSALGEMGALRSQNDILEKALTHLKLHGLPGVDPDVAHKFHIDLAVAAWRIGDFTRYSQLMSESSAFPKNWYRYFAESLLFLVKREYAKALPLLDVALRECTGPRDRGLVLECRGQAYEGLGQFAEAAHQIELSASAFEEVKDSRLAKKIRNYKGYAAFLRQDYGAAEKLLLPGDKGGQIVTVRVTYYRGDFVACEDVLGRPRVFLDTPLTYSRV